MTYRILDTFCKAGGCSKGYLDAGFEVVGVDIDPQPNYHYPFILGDALQILAGGNSWKASDGKWYGLNDFDAIHASPPCQKYSAMQHIHNNREQHPDLIIPVRNYLEAIGKPYIIENVVGAPLRVDLMLCGTMFGLQIIKHRIFESNFMMSSEGMRCNHVNVYDFFHGGEMARKEREKASKAQRIDWFMTREETRNAIPPVYLEFIGHQLLTHLESKND